MPDTNPDPKMMRRQQDLDTPESVEPGHRGASDSDTESRRAREAADEGRFQPGDDQYDAIFEANKAGDAKAAQAGRKPAKGESLASPGRSILGS